MYSTKNTMYLENISKIRVLFGPPLAMARAAP
jgi:hypothetical protein